MARRTYKYSLASKDSKIAGVCSTVGRMMGFDPTFIRIAVVAAALFVSFKFTLLAYVLAGVGLAVARNKRLTNRERVSDFDRMAQSGEQRSPTVHAMRTELDVNDRRLMAIDQHLSTPNDELAREIEALREDK